jgi:putative chitinase
LENNKLNDLADKDDLDGISDIINIGQTTKIGDANGYEHRSKYVKEWKTNLI